MLFTVYDTWHQDSKLTTFNLTEQCGFNSFDLFWIIPATNVVNWSNYREVLCRSLNNLHEFLFLMGHLSKYIDIIL